MGTLISSVRTKNSPKTNGKAFLELIGARMNGPSLLRQFLVREV